MRRTKTANSAMGGWCQGTELWAGAPAPRVPPGFLDDRPAAGPSLPPYGAGGGEASAISACLGHWGDAMAATPVGGSYSTGPSVSASPWADPALWQLESGPTPMISIGKRPPGPADPGDAYYYMQNNEYGGVEAGVSYYHVEGNNYSADVGGQADVRGFAWEEANKLRFGSKLTASMGRGKIELPGYGAVDAGLGTAGVEASIGEDGATFGLGANLAETSLTVGGESTDEQVRIGVSEGVGGWGRLHWNQGKDGFRNYGYGFDYGPLSVDMKTKDPLRTGIRKSLDNLGPLGVLAENWLVDLALPEGNLTEDLANRFGLTIKDADPNTTLGVAKDLASGVSPALGDYLPDRLPSPREIARRVNPMSILWKTVKDVGHSNSDKAFPHLTPRFPSLPDLPWRDLAGPMMPLLGEPVLPISAPGLPSLPDLPARDLAGPMKPLLDESDL